MSLRPFLFAAFLAATPGCASAIAPSDPAPVAVQARVTFEPYAFTPRDNRPVIAERGRLLVPENRDDPGSRMIELGFVRLRSTAARPGNPVVYLAGGPGGSGVATLSGPRQSVFLDLTAVADVILLDQRGVGLSDHTPDCAAEAPFDAARPLTEQAYASYYRKAVQHCAAVWEAAGVALAGYDTDQSADDLEALRQALGASRIDLMGISYGTHLALATVRRHPGSIGRVALASVEGMDQTVKTPAHVDAAFERLATVAERLPGRTERLTDVMRRVHARFAAPQPVNLTTPDGQVVTFHIDAFPLRMMAGGMAKNPDGLEQLAGFYDAVDQGRIDALAMPIYGGFMLEPVSLQAMPVSMDMASGLSPDRIALLRRQIPGSLMGLAMNFPMPHLSEAVPGLDLGDDFRREVSWAGPALIFSGDLDVRTPLEDQAQATAGLSNRTTVVVRNGGHDLFEADPEIGRRLVDFFAGRPVRGGDIVLPAPF